MGNVYKVYKERPSVKARTASRSGTTAKRKIFLTSFILMSWVWTYLVLY